MRISLVTPSLNKVNFIEASIRSVLDQNHVGLEYGVVDGVSSDGSLDILNRYQSRLSFLVSEPDNGMYSALNKGFSKCTGDVMGYIGADDFLLPWTLSVVTDIFTRFPDIQWITSQFPLTADDLGRVLRARRLEPPTASAFFRGANLPGFAWHSNGWIQQESTFWRRSLWERVGGFDESLRLAGDFDLWCRFMKLSEPVSVATPLAAFRRHGAQITELQANAYRQEALGAFLRHGGKADGYWISRLRAALQRLGLSKGGQTCFFDFRSNNWHHSAR